MGEHSGRYKWVANKLNEVGYEVYSLDHQGHGYSDGERVYVENFEDYAVDFNTYVEKVSSSSPHINVPNILLAHSLGGTIGLLAVHLKPNAFKTAIFSAPAGKVDPKVAKPYLVAIAGVLATLVPKMEIPGDKIDPEDVSRDLAIVKLYREDPLIYHGAIKARFGHESLMAIEKIRTQTVYDITIPILIMHGTKDKIILLEGSQYIYDNAHKTQEKKLKIYDGLYHELLNEPEKETVFNDINIWLSEHI